MYLLLVSILNIIGGSQFETQSNSHREDNLKPWVDDLMEMYENWTQSDKRIIKWKGSKFHGPGGTRVFRSLRDKTTNVWCKIGCYLLPVLAECI